MELSKGAPSGRSVGGVTPLLTHTRTHSHHTHTHTHTHTVFWESVRILTKCVGKILQNSINIPAKPNSYRQCQLLKKLYQICTDDYDNNEYLAVKYIRFFTNNII